MEKLLEGHVFGGWGVCRRCGVVIWCVQSRKGARGTRYSSPKWMIYQVMLPRPHEAVGVGYVSPECRNKWDDRFFIKREFNMNPESL
jgi:hypothetical protein